MEHVPDAKRTPFETVPSTRAPHRRRWSFAAPARLAALLLLLLWIGPVTFVQTDAVRLLRLAGAPGRASADTQVIPAGQGMHLARGTLLKLRMRDGRLIEGRFVERTLLDSAAYARRFEAHVRASAFVPLTLGETLHVSLRDGREWTAPFSGYAEMALLLQGPEGPEPLRVPFEFAREIHGANGDPIDPGELAWAFRSGTLPSAEALVLEDRDTMRGIVERRGGSMRVAVEDIASASAVLSDGSQVAIIILVSVVASVVLAFLLIRESLRDSVKSCGSTQPVLGSRSLGASALTTRPFDRYRGCFVGEAVTAADPWPGPAGGGPTSTARASRAR